MRTQKFYGLSEQKHGDPHQVCRVANDSQFLQISCFDLSKSSLKFVTEPRTMFFALAINTAASSLIAMALGRRKNSYVANISLF